MVLIVVHQVLGTKKCFDTLKKILETPNIELIYASEEKENQALASL